MAENSITKNTPTKKYFVLMTVMLVYLSNGAFAKIHIPAWVRVLAVIVISLFVVYYSQNRQLKLKRKSVLLATMFIGLQIITILFYGMDLDADAFLLLSIVAALIFSTAVNEKEFLIGYRWVITVIAIGSIFFYILGFISPFYVDKIPDVLLQSNWGGTYIFLWTFIVRNNSLYTYYRSLGIFTEPGQYQIFLSIGLIIEFFCVEKPNWKILAVLFAAIVTCNSTNGYIVAVLVLLAYLLNKEVKQTAMQRRMRSGVILVVCAAVVWLVFSENEFIDNLIQSNHYKLADLNTTYSYTDTGSAQARRRAFDTALQIWLEHPFVGCGYTGMRAYTAALGGEDIIMTFSPLNWFARFGTLYGIIVNVLYCMSFGRRPNKLASKLVLCVALIAMISAQAVTSDIFIWVLIFYGFENLINRKPTEYIC